MKFILLSLTLNRQSFTKIEDLTLCNPGGTVGSDVKLRKDVCVRIMAVGVALAPYNNGTIEFC